MLAGAVYSCIAFTLGMLTVNICLPASLFRSIDQAPALQLSCDHLSTGLGDVLRYT